MICTRCGYNRGESTERTAHASLDDLEAIEVLETADNVELALASTVVKAYGAIHGYPISKFEFFME